MLYAGARLAGSPGLYSPDEIVREEAAFAQVKPRDVLFERWPFYASLLRPLAALPYRTAYAVFEGINLAAFGVFLYWFARRDPAFWLVGAASIPVLTALVLGQDVLLLLLVCGGAIQLVRGGNRFWAGALLSLCVIKAHLFLMLPVMLIARREGRILAGGAVGGAVLFGVSALAQGWSWPMAYLELLRRAPDPTPYTSPNLRGLLMATVGDSLVWELMLAALVAALVIRAAARLPVENERDTFESAFAMATAAGLLTSHHAYIQDCSLLLLVPALVHGRARVRTGALILLAPPFYFLLGAGVPSIALPLGMGALLVAFGAPSPHAVLTKAAG